MYCPFVKGNCVSNCVFNENNNCNLLKTIKNIEFNTNTDQTESWSINHELENISEKLDCIIKKLEQSVD